MAVCLGPDPSGRPIVSSLPWSEGVDDIKPVLSDMAPEACLGTARIIPLPPGPILPERSSAVKSGLESQGGSPPGDHQAQAGQTSAGPTPTGPLGLSRRGVWAVRFLPQSWTTEAAGRPAGPAARDGQGSVE